MSTKDIIWGIIEAVIWYAFVYYLLYALKNPVDLRLAALILLVLVYLGTVTCPLVHKMDAWRRIWKE